MPAFSIASQKKLDSCNPQLVRLFARVIRVRDCTIVCGARGEAEQNEAHRRGFSKLRYPQSKHNKAPSRAVDVAPFINGGIPWNDATEFYYFAGFVMGVAAEMKIPIKYGGDWDRDSSVTDETFMDLAHYELV